MLRMRRASPHGKWIETTRRKPVRAEKGRPASVRTSPPAMRQDSEMRFDAFRSQAGLRTRQFRGLGSVPTPGRLPSHPLHSEQWRLERPALTYRCGGSAGMAGGFDPRRTGFPFHPARLETGRRTPAALIIATPAAVPGDWLTCYNFRPFAPCLTAAVLP
jgi:hypothetical protein